MILAVNCTQSRGLPSDQVILQVCVVQLLLQCCFKVGSTLKQHWETCGAFWVWFSVTLSDYIDEVTPDDILKADKTASGVINPLSPHNALKHHFTSLKTDLIVLHPRVLERKFPWNWFTNTWQFSLFFKPHQIIFIHHKSRIATAIRGL